MQSKVKLRKLCAQCKAIFCHLSTLRSNFIVYRDTWYINTATQSSIWYGVTQRDPSPLTALSLLCRLFPLRRRDDLFGQIVQLALLLFRCINCNYWPNGANRLQIAFRESSHSRISTYCSDGKFRVKAAGSISNGNSKGQHHVEHSCRCCPDASHLKFSQQQLPCKLTSFHQQQERSFPELPAG